MEYIIAVVNKYKERLDPNNDVKKILRALQKLNEVDMTIEILQKTEVGKAVNKLKKVNGIGSFAKEIVLKWKKLLHVPEYQQSVLSINYIDHQSSKNEEYDPTKNWEMKSKKEKKSKTREEYDPTQNWQMKKKKPKHDYEHSYNDDYNEEVREDKDDSPHDEDASPIASDDDYPSSREDQESPQLDDEDADMYAPSVSSETLSSKSHSPDYNPYYGRITDNLKKQKLSKSSKSEKNTDKHKKNVLTNHLVTENENLKKNKEMLKKLSTSSNSNATTQVEISSAKKKSEKILNNKRKAEENSSTVLKKSRNEEIKSKKTTKTKHKEIKKTNSNDLSFEQFMMMDTAKIKKKKKVKPASNKSDARAPKLVSSSSKVQIQLPKVLSNYRPLPSVAPVDVRRTSSKSDLMTDELAAALHTQRNSKRMQVYSGQKVNHLPKMLSLYDQCMNVLLNNIDKLDVIGVPYDIIKPVLERCNVEQLYRLEDSNPYLLNDTGDLWQRHAEQDFRRSQPEEMESWREMYLRLYDAREEKLARLTHSIQAKVNKAKPLEKRTKLAYVGVGTAKAPRNVLRAQMKYGTAGKKPIPYEPSSDTRDGSSSASSFKKQASEIRLSVPPGTITASTVDNMGGNSRNAMNKKQAPRVAPMMAKTLKSINKLRYRR